jgi:hypothetical protein
MCEIDVTKFVMNEQPEHYSASRAELGDNAGRITWSAAMREAEHKPLLTAPEHFDALRQWAKETGAWDAAERAAWSDDDCNALFIQIISSDMRDMGLDDCFVDEFDYEAWCEKHDGGGSLYPGDNGRWYYYLGS